MDSVTAKDSSEVGIAGRLFDSCLDLYSKLDKTTRQSNVFPEAQNHRLHKQLERFLLWGDGFNPAKGELDRILGRSSDLSRLVLSILKEIASILCKRLLVLVNPSEPIQERLEDISGLLVNVDYINSKEDEASYPEDSDSDSEDADAKLDDIIECLKIYIDRLSDSVLELATRRVPAKLLARARASPRAPRVHKLRHDMPSTVPSLELLRDGEDLNSPRKRVQLVFEVSQGAIPFCQNLKDKFPKAEQKFIERLAEANWKRYTRLRECRGIAANLVATNDCQKTVFQDSAIGSSIESAPDTKKTRPTRAASQTSFTSFISADTCIGDYGAHIPLAPDEALIGKPFGCEYCGQIVGNLKSKVDWKGHVISDLRPYACTNAQCDSGLLTFPTRREWWAHECEVHRTEIIWRCKSCGAPFRELNSFKSHLKALGHGSLARASMEENIADAEETAVRRLEDQQCPFCLKPAADAPPTFRSHVGQHMLEVALSALPRGGENEDEDSVADTDHLDTAQTPSELDSRLGGILDNEGDLKIKSHTLEAALSALPRGGENEDENSVTDPDHLDTALTLDSRLGVILGNEGGLKTKSPPPAAIAVSRFHCKIGPCSQRKGFARKVDLERHWAEYHHSVKRPFQCPWPGCEHKGANGFYRWEMMLQHQDKEHGNRILGKGYPDGGLPQSRPHPVPGEEHPRLRDTASTRFCAQRDNCNDPGCNYLHDPTAHSMSIPPHSTADGTASDDVSAPVSPVPSSGGCRGDSGEDSGPKRRVLDQISIVDRGSPPSSPSLSIQEVLDQARRATDLAALAPHINDILTDIWRKLRAHPTTYILTADEFAILSFSVDGRGTDTLAAAAIARFWDARLV